MKILKHPFPPDNQPTYDNLNYLVIDLETSIKNRGENAVGKMKASPFHPDNQVVLSGRSGSYNRVSDAINAFVEINKYPFKNEELLRIHDIHLLVGQNIKFDLLYLLMHDYDRVMEFFRRGGVVWDTMQAEYLLSNQQELFIPLGNKYKTNPFAPYDFILDEKGDKILLRQGLAEKYGGTDKHDRIKAYWDADIDTEDIPHEELSDYLRHDVLNTELVFRTQHAMMVTRGQEFTNLSFRHFKSKGRNQEFTNLIWTQMQAIVATTLMEYNGMKFDIERASEEATVLAKEHDEMTEKLTRDMWNEFRGWVGPTVPTMKDINPGSTKMLNSYLFGMDFYFTASMPVTDAEGNIVYYKSGKKIGTIKTRKETIILECPHPLIDDTKLKGMLSTNTLGFKLDNDVIKKVLLPYLTSLPLHASAITCLYFLTLLLDHRKLTKDLKTYYIGLIKLVWPTDNCIHGNINHCSTATGRLSSSNPNQQNISGK